MTTTIFYSWQSDLPNGTNRTFIEDALEKALKTVAKDGAVQGAERDEGLSLDKDTKGVPGIPPIADVILKKISASTAFVPDLTFVGTTKAGRLLPNPNVLIEYGWALRSLGNSRIVPVMNIAFGDANADTLPFNMRHLRHPITYELREDANSEERKQVKAELVKDLSAAIRLIIKHNPPTLKQSHREHVAVKYTSAPSNFLQPNEALGTIGGTRGPERTLVLPDNQHLFLRLMPNEYIEEIASSKKAYEMLSQSEIRPLSDQFSGWDLGRNRHGAFVYARDGETVLSVTQLFRNKELWGIDAETIDKKSCMQHPNVNFGYFPASTLETTFVLTLSAYLSFCRQVLQLPLPLKLITGATRVDGYRMTAPDGMTFGGFERFAGRVVDQDIVYEGEVRDYATAPTEILRPFFDYLWEACGLERPDGKRS